MEGGRAGEETDLPEELIFQHMICKQMLSLSCQNNFYGSTKGKGTDFLAPCLVPNA